MIKRDSIEFLWDELKPFLPTNYTVDESVKILSILNQAKAMHKDEHRETWDECLLGSNPEKTFEDHYNETFGE